MQVPDTTSDKSSVSFVVPNNASVEHKLAANTFPGLTAVVCSQIIVVVVKTQTLASPVFSNDLFVNFLD